MRFLLVSFVFLLTACTQPIEQSNIPNSDYSPDYKISGVRQSEVLWGGVYRQWQLITLIDKKSFAQTHYISTDIRYPRERGRFKTALDNSGNRLHIVLVNKDHRRCRIDDECIINESYGIELSEKYLKKKINSGFTVKIISDTGYSFTIPITNIMIQKQFESLDNFKRM
ncbi:MAG: hypothetical protein WCJ33_04105 [Pseudomonadota bacterium]